ncbi:hypothetical protein NESM_000231500 [Novymonas esmeraldas]|uniref:Uncharacterized protein n=1 Tax=Novymonas esmeraldas TaxID=1808958 RepID=A0AAW0F7W2_9TRYP
MPVVRVVALPSLSEQGSGERGGGGGGGSVDVSRGDAGPTEDVGVHDMHFASRSLLSRLLTPPLSPTVSPRLPDGPEALQSRSNNSSLFYPCHSSSARSLADRGGCVSPTLASANRRSFRHNPYMSSPRSHGSPLMSRSPASISFAEHESVGNASFSGGSGDRGRRCIIRSRHTKSASPSSQAVTSTAATVTPVTAGGGLHPSGLPQPQLLISPFARHRSAESLSRECSFMGRSGPASASQSHHGSPAGGAGSFAALIPPARSPLHHASAIYADAGVSNASTLYQSLGSSNATLSTNSNNPYVGVRMTPETALLLPDTVAQTRGFEATSQSAGLESRTHPLSSPYGGSWLQPSTVPSLTRGGNQQDSALREAPQPWLTGAQHSPPPGVHRSSPAQSPLSVSLTGSGFHAMQTNMPPPPIITTIHSTGGTAPLSGPSTPPVRRTPPPDSGASPARHLHLLPPPSSVTGASVTGSGMVLSSDASGADFSHSSSIVRNETRQFSPLSTVPEVSISPVPVAEMEKGYDAHNSTSVASSTPDGEVHRQRTASCSARSSPRSFHVAAAAATAHGTPPRIAASSPSRYHDACVYTPDTTQTADVQSAAEDTIVTRACSAEGGHVDDHPRSHSQVSCGGVSSANGMTAYTLAETGTPVAAAASLSARIAAPAVHPTAPATAAAHEHGDGVGEDSGEDEDDDGDGATAPGAKKKKKRTRRHRKVKVLEDLPPVASMKYLPPPPPPPLPTTTANSDRYYAVLLRWYTRLLATEGDFVDLATARNFDPATASAVLTAEGRQTSRGQYAAYVVSNGSPAAWAPRSPDSGPVSPPTGYMAPPYATGAHSQFFGGGAGGNAAVAPAAATATAKTMEVQVRCPRIERYMAACDIPAALSLFPEASNAAATAAKAVNNKGAGKAQGEAAAVPAATATATATADTPVHVSDMASAVRWASDLEVWWFAYVFPHVAHPRHQTPLPPPLMPTSATSPHIGSPQTGSITPAYDYGYGWASATPQPMMMNPMQNVYGAYGVYGGGMMGSGNAVMPGTGMQSPLYGPVPVPQPQMPSVTSPIQSPYVMGMYRAY